METGDAVPSPTTIGSPTPVPTAEDAAANASSLFRTSYGEAPKPKKIAPIKEGGRDPATGKFTPASPDPNAGVIPELRGDTQDDGPPQPEPGQEPPPPPSSFVPVEVDGSRFETAEDLQNHIKRVRATASAESRRRADLERQNAELMAKLNPESEPEPASTEPESPTNPFETASIIDNEALWTKIHEDIGGDKPVVALARLADHFETQIKDLVKFINHSQGKEVAPMHTFLKAMADINQTSEFMKGMSEVADESGALRYPNMRSRSAISALTSILSRHNLPLTPENFDLAYLVWQGPSKPEGERPRAEPDPAVNHAASSAAAVGGGRTRAPDPRAEPRKRSTVEEMNAIETSRGLFRISQ